MKIIPVIVMNEPLDTRQLRTLVEVMRTGSFQAAGDCLCCVPSAVSNRMKALSERVGTPLFVQDGRKVRPTAAGEKLARYAIMILTLCERAAVDVANGSGGALPFRLGVIDTLAGVFLPGWLRALKDAMPNLPIAIETGHSLPLVEKLRSGVLDAAFVAGSWDEAELLQDCLIPEELVLITAKQAPAPDAARPQAALVFACPCTYRARLEQWAAGEGVTIDSVIEFSSAEAIIGSVAAGLGFTILPRSVLDQSRYRGEVSVRTLPGAIGQIPTVLLRNRDMPRHDAMKPLMAVLSAAY